MSVRSLVGRVGLLALLGAPSLASAHTTRICTRDVGGVTTFYAGSYHSPYEAPSPVGKIIVDGFGYPFSGWIYPSALPADAICANAIGGGTPPAVVHYQTFTSAFDPGLHTITFDATTVIQAPWSSFAPMTFGGGACADADFDEICNDDDICPLDAANDGDGDGICANTDNCPLDYNPAQTDANWNGQGDTCEGVVCGNGLLQGSEECDDGNIAGGDGCSAICTVEIVDTDGDGVADDEDLCLGDDAYGDTDGDGICEDIDLCVGDDDFGDDDADLVCEDLDACEGDDATGDDDGDLVCDDLDLCDGDDATGDTDGDVVCDDLDECHGDDATGDSDADNVCDDLDQCLGDDASGDTDGDDVCDTSDNCPVDANADQSDVDADGIGNVCEADTDTDGVIDDYDNCAADFNADQADNDFDGAGDVCDPDDDDDGYADEYDNCPVLANDQLDFDFDGVGDACDGDDDADGVVDESDLCPATPAGVYYDADGCSGTQRVDLTCDADAAWANHGAYVSCVVAAVNEAQADGLLTNKEAAAIKRAAAQSDIGK